MRTTSLKLLVASLAALAASAASAARATEPAPRVPGADVGLVGLSLGFRSVPDAPFAAGAAKANLPMLSHSIGGPEAHLPLTYRVDLDWSVLVEGGWGRDRYTVREAGAVDLQTMTLQAGAQRAFHLSKTNRWEPFLEAGIGYYFSTWSANLSPNPVKNAEANVVGAFAGAGLRVALTDALGLTLEERYAFATVNLAGLADAAVGGNTVAAGLYYVWPGG